MSLCELQHSQEQEQTANPCHSSETPITARGFSSSAEQCLLANSLPIQHKPTHKYHVATLHFRSYTPAVAQLNLAVEFARRTTAALSIPCSNVVSLPTRTELQTVPTGPFVHKKSQENFWRKTHKRALKLWDADEESLSVCLEYLRTNSIPGVGIRVQQVLYRPVGFSKDYQVKEESELKQTSGTEEKIKEMADEIVAGADAAEADETGVDAGTGEEKASETSGTEADAKVDNAGEGPEAAAEPKPL